MRLAAALQNSHQDGGRVFLIFVAILEPHCCATVIGSVQPVDGEQCEPVVGGAVGCGEGGQCQPGVGREFHHLELKGEAADDGMVVDLGAGSVQSHVVVRPPVAECLATGGQLTDEIRQIAVIGVFRGIQGDHVGVAFGRWG